MTAAATFFESSEPIGTVNERLLPKCTLCVCVRVCTTKFSGEMYARTRARALEWTVFCLYVRYIHDAMNGTMHDGYGRFDWSWLRLRNARDMETHAAASHRHWWMIKRTRELESKRDVDVDVDVDGRQPLTGHETHSEGSGANSTNTHTHTHIATFWLFVYIFHCQNILVIGSWFAIDDHVTEWRQIDLTLHWNSVPDVDQPIAFIYSTCFFDFSLCSFSSSSSSSSYLLVGSSHASHLCLIHHQYGWTSWKAWVEKKNDVHFGEMKRNEWRRVRRVDHHKWLFALALALFRHKFWCQSSLVWLQTVPHITLCVHASPRMRHT